VPVTVRTFPTVAEAAAALANERDARFFGGGTLIMRRINEGAPPFRIVIRTADPTLREIRSSGSRILIGAHVTMAQVLASRELDFLHPVARAVGGPAVRSQATVGGNLFARSPYGDFTAALLALDGTVLLHGGIGNREMPVADLLATPGRSIGVALVSAVVVDRPVAREAFRFRKVSRVKPKGVSVLSIAAHLPGGGRVQGARVAYGAMAPTPVRAPAVERALEGRTLDRDGIEPALAVALQDTSPEDDPIASAWYRREVLPVHLRRLLLGEAP
jgi:xanthine dehydrogenase small subunit